MLSLQYADTIQTWLKFGNNIGHFACWTQYVSLFPATLYHPDLRVCTGAQNLAPPPGFDAQTVQVVASHYTDWAILAPQEECEDLYISRSVSRSLLGCCFRWSVSEMRLPVRKTSESRGWKLPVILSLSSKLFSLQQTAVSFLALKYAHPETLQGADVSWKHSNEGWGCSVIFVTLLRFVPITSAATCRRTVTIHSSSICNNRQT